METCTIATRNREEMLDITDRVRAVVREKGWKRGAVALFCPHTTCGLTINEGADPDVRRDMTAFFSRLVPLRDGWRHAEGNSDAHIKASLMGPSLFVIVRTASCGSARGRACTCTRGTAPAPARCGSSGCRVPPRRPARGGPMGTGTERASGQ